MAKCPTCDAQVAWDSAECQICLTVFAGESQRKPIGDSRDEKQKLRERYGEVLPQGPSNPYAPPDASVDEGSGPIQQGRPALVWVITIVFGFGVIWTLGWLLLVLTNIIPTYDEQGQAAWNRLSLATVIVPLINSSLSLCGLVLLFLMRTKATVFLTASFVLSVAGTAYSFATQNMAAAMGTGGLTTMAISYVLWAGVLWYAYQLRNDGRLR